MGLVTMQSVCC